MVFAVGTDDDQAGAEAGNQAMAEAMAKMSPEQRAMYEQSVKNMPKGGVPAAASAGPGSMQFGGGMMGKIAKMSRKKADVGGPENWGPFVAEGHWSELGPFLPKLDKPLEKAQ